MDSGPDGWSEGYLKRILGGVMQTNLRRNCGGIALGIGLFLGVGTCSAADVFETQSVQRLIEEAAVTYSAPLTAPLTRTSCVNPNGLDADEIAKLEEDLKKAKDELTAASERLLESEKKAEEARAAVVKAVMAALGNKPKELIKIYFPTFTGDPTKKEDIEKLLPAILKVWMDYQFDLLKTTDQFAFLNFPEALTKLGLTKDLFSGPNPPGVVYTYWSRLGSLIIYEKAVKAATDKVKEITDALNRERQKIQDSCTVSSPINTTLPAAAPITSTFVDQTNVYSGSSMEVSPSAMMAY